MKVLISEKLEAGCAAILTQRGLEVDQLPGLAPEELQRLIGQYEGLIVRSSTQVNEDLLRAARRLKVVGRAGAGVDNIDVAAATRHGVIAMNTPGGNSVSTAEHSFAMLMALARNIPQATASLKAGKWDRSRYTGVELAGKTIGVLGLGKVGREVALRASSFKMKVLGYDPFVSEEMSLSFGTQMAPLEQIYAEADFITVHLPLTAQTRHLISGPQLAQCKEGVFLLNCARGGIIDEAELLRALDRGKVAGAALDVFVEEPPGLTGLVTHERVICTPHLGASTREAQATVALQIAEQVSDALLNGVIRNAVNVPSVEPEAYQKLRPFIELAERLGRIQAQLSEGQLERITVEYHGDVTAMPTSPLTAAVLKGIMGNISDEPVNFVNAPLFAQQRGVRVDELKSSEHEDYASLITVIYQTATARRITSGTLFGKSNPRLVRLDEYSLDAIPEGHMLFYINEDVPGVIGRIGTVMGSHRVNIAQMSCGRHQVGGRALTVLNVDSLIPDAVLAEILAHSNIVWAKQISL
ncbi:MAG: phosphoglycerate dehydrogenase [Candidatus Latescibacteria bacterium]|nr:phosphoglycerate dehydrogenase [Candidatus Latescibacterota bacterium]